ncbi:MAG: ribbon-helix-helix domain-containing protein [Roseiflexaceae bacterium]|nr:ribbon-helix-helix domain-containing protein [Roseiflexaceae bacterium]
MTTVKVAITLDQELLAQINQLVAQHVFPNRSKAIQAAIADKIARFAEALLG